MTLLDCKINEFSARLIEKAFDVDDVNGDFRQVDAAQRRVGRWLGLDVSLQFALALADAEVAYREHRNEVAFEMAMGI